jgi:hypothetical protein
VQKLFVPHDIFKIKFHPAMPLTALAKKSRAPESGVGS